MVVPQQVVLPLPRRRQRRHLLALVPAHCYVSGRYQRACAGPVGGGWKLSQTYGHARYCGGDGCDGGGDGDGDGVHARADGAQVCVTLAEGE